MVDEDSPSDNQSIDWLTAPSPTQQCANNDFSDDETIDPFVEAIAERERCVNGIKTNDCIDVTATSHSLESNETVDLKSNPDCSNSAIKARLRIVEYESEIRHDNILSPATRTLNNLSQSQQSANLFYDMSQLEYDVAESLVLQRHNDGTRNTRDIPTGERRFTGTKIAKNECRKRKTGDEKHKDSENKENYKQKPKKSNPSTYNRAISIETVDARTGKLLSCFPSLNAVAKSLGVFPTKVKRAIATKEVCKGVIFRYSQQDSKKSSSSNVATDHVRGLSQRLRFDDESSLSDQGSEENMRSRSSSVLCKTRIDSKAKKDVANAIDKDTVQKSKHKIPTTEPVFLPYEQCRKPELPSNAISSSKEKNEASTEMNNFVIEYIAIGEEGALGLNIGLAKPPSQLIEFVIQKHKGASMYRNECVRNKSDPINSTVVVEKAMVVIDAAKNSLGERYGIRPNDWIFFVSHKNCTAKRDGTLYLDYDKTKEELKTGRRPISFAIARLNRSRTFQQSYIVANKSTSVVSPTCTINASKQTFVTSPSNTKTTLQGTNDGRGNSPRSTNIVPTSTIGCSDSNVLEVEFCHLCRSEMFHTNISARTHHPWCRKNPFFCKSGASILFERMMNGMRSGCKACTYEMQEGSTCPKTMQHSKQCKLYQDRIKEVNEVNRENGQTGIAKIEKPYPSIQSNAIQSKKCDMDLSDSDISSAGESESVYQGQSPGPRQWLGPIANKTLSQTALNTEKRQSSSTLDNPRRKKSTQTTTCASMHTHQKPTSLQASERVGQVHVLKNVAAPSSCSRNVLDNRAVRGNASHANEDRLIPFGARTPDENEEIADESHEKPTISWYACENQWGEENWCDIDVVAFRTDRLYSTVEMMALAGEQRFIIFPFVVQYPHYHKTHCTPEEGFQAITLKRNFLATLPWGFTIKCHDFGGACLVKTVDLISPATSATFTGGGPESLAPLLVNDMIIEINGKRVGGMTMCSVMVELEITGPRLTLLISRYKFANELQQQLSTEDATQNAAVDYCINDDRRLDWNDIGLVLCDTKASCNDNYDDIPDESVEMTCHEDNRQCRPCSDHTNRKNNVRNNQLERNLSPAEEQVRTSQAKDETNVDNPQKLNVQENSPRLLDCQVPASTCFKSIDNPLGHFEQIEQGASDTIENLTEITRSTGIRSAKTYTASVHSHNNEKLCTQKLTSWRSEENFAGIQNLTPSSSESSAEDYTGKVVLPCVCGSRHSKSDERFWLQCENCDSWFHTISFCVGFTELEAPYIKKWICGGCQPPDVPVESKLSPMAKALSPITTVTQIQSFDSSYVRTEQTVPSYLQHDASKLISNKDAVNGKLKERNLQNRDETCSDDNQQLRQPDNFTSIANKDETNIQPSKKIKQNADGNWRRPKGCAPSGFEWDSSFGHWRQKKHCGMENPGKLTGDKLKHEIVKRKLSQDNVIAPINNKDMNSIKIKKATKTSSPPTDIPTSSALLDPTNTFPRIGTRIYSTICINEEPKDKKKLINVRGRNTAKKEAHGIVGGPATVFENQTLCLIEERTVDVLVSEPANEIFKEGDMVMIQKHSWPGVNNEEGVAKVLKAYVDEDGDQLYDVKYAIGRKSREVLAKFLSKHDFYF